MNPITVSLGERSYPVVLADSFDALPRWLTAARLPPEGWVVSHRSLLDRYGAALLRPLARAGWRLSMITVPEAERSKSLAMAQRLIQRLARRPPLRLPTLIAFGGGVVGDLTGFVAAIYRRGLPYVQVPTTLLAQVDSAIGGKVGVDLPQGKNLLGAFYQPRLVFSNLRLLGSLPLRQRRSGFAEVLKYAAIADRALWVFLETHLEACLRVEPRAARVMVERSAAIKARVVSQDERDTRDRRIHLNFGHTLGHALEAATGFRRLTHGEAIAIGMCAATALSVALGRLAPPEGARVIRLIARAGLPVCARGVSRRAVQWALRYDKKFVRGTPRWVILTRIGHAGVSEAVSERLVRRVLAQYVSA